MHTRPCTCTRRNTGTRTRTDTHVPRVHAQPHSIVEYWTSSGSASSISSGLKTKLKEVGRKVTKVGGSRRTCTAGTTSGATSGALQRTTSSEDADVELGPPKLQEDLDSAILQGWYSFY